MGSANTVIDCAQEADEPVIVKRRNEGHIQECASSCGHSLGKVLQLLKAKLAIVSTPENSKRFGRAGDPVAVMDALERLSFEVLPLMVTAYDFKGSSSAMDCGLQKPDRDMHEPEWTDPEQILSSQWCRYWKGRVRGTLTTLLMGADTRPEEVTFRNSDGKSSQNFPTGERVVFAVSISGGQVTQVEKSLLPETISGSMTDLSTRGLDLPGVSILWLHFECVDDLVKALQGYGGIDLRHVQELNWFGQPGKWTDGPRTAQFDLLNSGSESDAEERREALLATRKPTAEMLSRRMLHAIDAGSRQRLRELLKEGADPNSVDAAGLPILHKAAARADHVAVQMLLEAGAERDRRPEFWRAGAPPTALEYLTALAADFDRGDGGVVQESIEKTLSLLSP